MFSKNDIEECVEKTRYYIDEVEEEIRTCFKMDFDNQITRILMNRVQSNKERIHRSKLSPEIKVLLKQYKKLNFNSGILCRNVEIKTWKVE